MMMHRRQGWQMEVWLTRQPCMPMITCFYILMHEG